MTICKYCGHGGMVKRGKLLKCEWCGRTIQYAAESSDETFINIDIFTKGLKNK